MQILDYITVTIARLRIKSVLIAFNSRRVVLASAVSGTLSVVSRDGDTTVTLERWPGMSLTVER